MKMLIIFSQHRYVIWLVRVAVVMNDSIKYLNSIASYGVPDSKVHGDNMWPIWRREDPGGPHVGPMNLAITGITKYWQKSLLKGFVHYIRVIYYW